MAKSPFVIAYIKAQMMISICIITFISHFSTVQINTITRARSAQGHVLSSCWSAGLHGWPVMSTTVHMGKGHDGLSDSVDFPSGYDMADFTLSRLSENDLQSKTLNSGPGQNHHGFIEIMLCIVFSYPWFCISRYPSTDRRRPHRIEEGRVILHIKHYKLYKQIFLHYLHAFLYIFL